MEKRAMEKAERLRHRCRGGAFRCGGLYLHGRAFLPVFSGFY